MKKLRQFDSLIIEDLTKDRFHQPVHSQTYYEVIYIMEGTGLHYLNGRQHAYRAGSIFFVSPEDSHYLEIQEVTRFVVIKFTDSYFGDKLRLMPNALLRVRPDEMMSNRGFVEAQLTFDEPTARHIAQTMHNLSDYRAQKGVGVSAFVFFQILSLFSLFQQAWADTSVPSLAGFHREGLISFIHRHIYDPEKIQIAYLAHVFGISANYFSKYFKNNFGISYRKYINDYKIRLIETRVASGFTVRQIAEEFGFADESHLSHYFKSQTSVKLSEYRSGLGQRKEA